MYAKNICAMRTAARNTGQYAKMPVRNPGLETFAIIAAILIGHRPLAIMDGWSVG